jgi:4-hydroxybenzoate polyprenyltransferase
MMKVVFLYVAMFFIVAALYINIWAAALAVIGTTIVVAYILSDIRRVNGYSSRRRALR